MSQKKKSIAQEAGVYRRKLTRAGIKTLTDYKGQEVPVEYIPPLELVKHFRTQELISEAKEIQGKLAAFKAKCQATGDDLYERLLAKEEIKATSVGGFTVNDFAKNARIEFRMDTVMEVSHEQLAIAKEYKNRFIEEEAGELSSIISELLNLAFETTEGKIDPRRGRALNKYRDRIPNKNFRKFLDHYNQAFDLTHTKRFERFLEKNDQGEYDSILLTYSSIEPEENENAQE